LLAADDPAGTAFKRRARPQWQSHRLLERHRLRRRCV